VIHAVGPVWHGGDDGEAAALASCYTRAMALAGAAGLGSIAFPAISTGIYGFPPERAAPIAITATIAALSDAPSVQRVVFCCFSDPSARLHRSVLAQVAL